MGSKYSDKQKQTNFVRSTKSKQMCTMVAVFKFKFIF